LYETKKHLKDSVFTPLNQLLILSILKYFDNNFKVFNLMETNINSSVRVAKNVKIQLDRFNYMNYTRWVDKIMFLLTSLKIYYILDLNLSALPKP
jgi:uncharacterized membrane protein YdbT with pleckstrin-like domain